MVCYLLCQVESKELYTNVNFVRYDDGKAVYELKSGTYEFIT